jgi:hypothetical protein
MARNSFSRILKEIMNWINSTVIKLDLKKLSIHARAFQKNIGELKGIFQQEKK